MAKRILNFTAKKSEFVEHLLSGKGIAEAARRVGVSGRTGYRWASEPETVKRKQLVDEEVLRTVAEKIEQGAIEAVDALRELTKGAKDYVRVQAASHLTELYMRLYDAQVEQQVRTLEEWAGVRDEGIENAS